jgi:hypothetical protein
MEKETIEFEQFLAASMALFSTEMSYYILLRLRGIFFSNPAMARKYEYVESPLEYLKDIVERKGITFQLREGLELNTDISEKINYKRPCTVEEYLVIVSHKSFFNDMFYMMSMLKDEAKKVDELERDQYTKKLHSFYQPQ